MRNELILPLVFLLTTLCLTVADVIMDLAEGSGVEHIGLELSIITSGAVGAYFILQSIVGSYKKKFKQSQEDLIDLRAKASQWRKEAQSVLQGLADQIDRQFSDWQFTLAEKEVALLLVKGLSHKEIADIRKVQEKTVRQQCTAIYRKAGVAGRAELSAFFLEDLLLPRSN